MSKYFPRNYFENEEKEELLKEVKPTEVIKNNPQSFKIGSQLRQGKIGSIYSRPRGGKTKRKQRKTRKNGGMNRQEREKIISQLHSKNLLTDSEIQKLKDKVEYAIAGEALFKQSVKRTNPKNKSKCTNCSILG